ncbi:MAG: 3-deoxy-D-manno-octulosonic acid transferase [Rhodobacteraceae bacterium]|nr:3-deoxy-D-manno-octulosonic acid transferase [Paracoccaceae bacterium]
MGKGFPSLSLRLALLGYAVLWATLLPVVILYIFKRAKRDSRYSKHMGERFGRYKDVTGDCVWIHAVSLGEMRAAAPLIKTLLKNGERIVTTHFTPAGRTAAKTLFPEACESGNLIPVYVPFEFDWVFRRFFKAFSPKYGLVMEVEMWPRMIASARRHEVPLFMCNGHYPEKSYQRDKRKFGLRGRLVTGFTALFIKSEPDAERFRGFGATNVFVTGELRFDQFIPPNQINAADILLKDPHRALLGRTIITLASVVEGEDPQYIDAIKRICREFAILGRPAPLFVYVPRAPERFVDVARLLNAEGFRTARRTEILDVGFGSVGNVNFKNVDILIGDSLGEMFFYLALADIVIVGGGFVPTGAHNVIEPLALKKTVLVGPHIWTIEYPALEAIEAGALESVETIEALVASIVKLDNEEAKSLKKIEVERFYAAHTGAVDSTLSAIRNILNLNKHK